MTFSDRTDTLKTLHNKTIQIGCVNVIVVVNCWGTVSKRPRSISSRHERLPVVTAVHVVADVFYAKCVTSRYERMFLHTVVDVLVHDVLIHNKYTLSRH